MTYFEIYFFIYGKRRRDKIKQSINKSNYFSIGGHGILILIWL